MLDYLTILQGTASVWALAIENIYATVDLNNSYKMPKCVAHFYLIWN